MVHTESDQPDVDEIGRAARDAGLRIAVAESLTSGLLASRVGAGEGAADWFAGGVVAYHLDTKHDLLGMPVGIDPCSAACAEHLAVSVRDLLGADIAVATTGVGGPDAQDGHPPGTVYLGWSTAADTGSSHHRFEGDPVAVIEQTARAALAVLATLIPGDRTAS